MCGDCSNCKTIFDLGHVGLQGKGCIRNPMFLAQIAVPCSQNMLNESLYIQTPTKTLQWTQNLPGSTFSRVELGTRCVDGTTQYAFMKRPLISGKSLLYEACIQYIVRESLIRGGFARGAAQVYDIFKLKDKSICFSMEVFQEAKPLSTILPHVPDTTALILELLLQLAAMLWHLSVDIGMNHRDLKPSNLMLEVRPHPVPLQLKIGEKSVTIQSRFTISLVDFGFSCIGSTVTQVSDIAIGNVYSPLDPCPKDGRDLFMFLAFLYMDCAPKIGADLRRCFAKWLHNGTTGILGKIDKLGHEFDPWIYFITGSERIRSFDSTPETIFMDLKTMAA